MRSTFDELTKELEELRTLVASITPVNSALAGHQDSRVKQYVTIRRRFDYAAFAVALYASFEKFIENLVASYAKLVARRRPYARLPTQLMDKHLRETADLLLRGELGAGRYAGMSALAAVENLYRCLKGKPSYALNEPAIIAHKANLRTGEIDKLFVAVGINNVCGLVRRTDALLDWYCESNELAAAPQDGVPERTIKDILDDVVERRNQVAHRGGNPDELLGPDEMFDAIDFIKAFSKSVFSIAVGRYLQEHHAAPDQGIQLPQREHLRKKGRIVVVEKPAQRLFVGQPVFVVIDDTGARWGRIQSMQVDDTDVQAIEPGAAAANGVGIALDFKCPRDATLVALAAEDDAVWSPPPMAPASAT